MDNPPDESAGFTNNSTPSNRESRPLGSGMFTGSQNFTVTGHTFNNITNHHTAPSDFRMIPLRDIDLQHDIQVDQGVVAHQRRRGCVRRVYSAKVKGQKSKVTVAMYQGNGAEEEWRRNIVKYMSIRHPNMIQIYRAASSGGIYTTLYHDSVPLPFSRFTFCHSIFLCVLYCGLPRSKQLCVFHISKGF
ncbi:hypothetical protein DFH08DRAFT_167291 [Mycena albidolilacea]|uniref:Protein kinase domain-containing protein n=1 Tax=Mycena albidolilacea TaxID=1033008 RepID=A0AAD7F4X5_9AGAR|nr:hypothetical protein DFH08DRAFT_167291 [Mycena albidolilacea]